jgi:hypothetical protein
LPELDSLNTADSIIRVIQSTAPVAELNSLNTVDRIVRVFHNTASLSRTEIPEHS